MKIISVTLGKSKKASTDRRTDRRSQARGRGLRVYGRPSRSPFAIPLFSFFVAFAKSFDCVTETESERGKKRISPIDFSATFEAVAKGGDFKNSLGFPGRSAPIVTGMQQGLCGQGGPNCQTSPNFLPAATIKGENENFGQIQRFRRSVTWTI